MHDDGKHYYTNHTVTIMGYIEFCDEFGHLLYLLLVYDN